ncbi:Tetratricopeptide repeat-containing protein [Arboricoccus pini]|uniref:Tetratricopeptide repeat-containing protein n=1 Tax=Arboricoccus pini TaxID=1963835 RepID=A0A212R2S1_9PROT|nr:tetratricopeptide repeat protein [Arboricoccus pini]SNB66309.1 Tetratricopeptide repeat-containing protein [Arboricoccus pini]
MRSSNVLLVLVCLVVSSPAWSAALDDARQGSAAYIQGDLKGALASLSRAIDSGELSGGNLAAALNNRAVIYDAMGKQSEAIDDYERALSTTPDNDKLKANLARTLLRQGDAALGKGDKGTARRDYERAIALMPDSPEAAARQNAIRSVQGNPAGTQGSVAKGQNAAVGDSGSQVEQSQVPPETHGNNSGAASYSVVKAVNVRGGPDTGAPILSTLNEGEIVEAIGETNGWLALRLGDGGTGYVYGTYLQRR